MWLPQHLQTPSFKKLFLFYAHSGFLNPRPSQIMSQSLQHTASLFVKFVIEAFAEQSDVLFDTKLLQTSERNKKKSPSRQWRKNRTWLNLWHSGKKDYISIFPAWFKSTPVRFRCMFILMHHFNSKNVNEAIWNHCSSPESWEMLHITEMHSMLIIWLKITFKKKYIIHNINVFINWSSNQKRQERQW